jgi:hypothetical protein
MTTLDLDEARASRRRREPERLVEGRGAAAGVLRAYVAGTRAGEAGHAEAWRAIGARLEAPPVARASGWPRAALAAGLLLVFGSLGRGLLSPGGRVRDAEWVERAAPPSDPSAQEGAGGTEGASGTRAVGEGNGTGGTAGPGGAGGGAGEGAGAGTARAG